MKKFLIIFSVIFLSALKPNNINYAGYFKVGKPYKIDGVNYHPEINNEYSEVGIASWYGDKFHNKKTANGAIFNKYQMTAAHKTLPLPSIVKVTNLDNGESIIVTINDRGPFVGDRIIDLSEYAARELGFFTKGTAKVIVEFLKDETNDLHFDLFGETFLD
ncbi:MAG: septal ring lytic transglycosylase RlpA family protein [Rickettsiales bacterium]|nr:septal ring lytic transglycosylase RlpA family protein [Rickettsiales bacterium]